MSSAESARIRKEFTDEATAADADLALFACGEGALGLAIGVTLERLFSSGMVAKLGYAREKDYMVERLGLPARTGYQLLRLARETRGSEMLRRAVLDGSVSPDKALVVARVAKGVEEAHWTGLAARLTRKALVGRVRAAGKEPAGDDFRIGTTWLRMRPEDRLVYDGAIRAARRILGSGAPPWQLEEAVAMEWLGDHGALLPEEATEKEEPAGEEEPEETGRARRIDPPAAGTWSEVRKSVEREVRVLAEARHAVACGEDPFCANARALDARARRLSLLRERIAEPLGRLLAAFCAAGFFVWLGYRTFEEYARDRLGMAPRTVRERLWLTRRLAVLPKLREALKAGKVTMAKALLLARHAGREDVGERIGRAAEVPCEKVARETDAESERRDAALGVKRLWGPEEAMVTVGRSIVSARLWAGSRGVEIDDGRALALTGAHFLATHEEELRRRSRRKLRMAVLAQKDGRCWMPGCSNAADHVHHIRPRSRGGSDDPGNLFGACVRHHAAIHAGLIRVTPRSGGGLLIEYLPGDEALETWLMLGADELVRAA